MGDLELFIFWIATSVASVGMEISLGCRMVKDLADNGYKITNNSHNKLNRITDDNQKSIKKRKNKLLKFIPIINIFYAFYMAFEYFENRNDLHNGLYIMGLLEELSEFEKNEYKKNPTGFNAVLLSNTVEQKLRDASFLEVTVNYEKGKIYYEINGDTVCPFKYDDITILKAIDSATYLSLEEQKERILKFELGRLFNRIEEECDESNLSVLSDDNVKNDEVFSYKTIQELSIGEQKKLLKQMKNELLQQNVLEDTSKNVEKKSAIIKKRNK